MKFSTDLDTQNTLQAFEKLLSMIDKQREKCPWSREQTMESMRDLVIEETFELSEAVLEGETEDIKKELGDLLFHITFYARIASEKRSFTITDIIQTLCEKLVGRNPHIYGQGDAKDPQAVGRNWEHIKLKEKKNQSVLGGVPPSLPSLIKAKRILEKAHMAGFSWGGKEKAWQRIQEKLKKLSKAGQESPEALGQQERSQEELGDLLFALVVYAKFFKLNPEEALEKANRKFIRRVQHVEQQITKQGKKINQMQPQELQDCWEESK